MSEAPSRWRSKAVRLVVLGTAGSLAALLTGCSSGPESHYRNVYANQQDCERDYDVVRCTSGAQTGLTRVLGPAYRVVGGRPSSCTSSDPGPGRNGALSPRTGVERAGFGPSCSRRRTASGGRSTRFFGG